jgi:hypothetical protein
MLQRSWRRIPIAPELPHRPETREAADKLHDVRTHSGILADTMGLSAQRVSGIQSTLHFALKNHPLFGTTAATQGSYEGVQTCYVDVQPRFRGTLNTAPIDTALQTHICRPILLLLYIVWRLVLLILYLICRSIWRQLHRQSKRIHIILVTRQSNRSLVKIQRIKKGCNHVGCIL